MLGSESPVETYSPLVGAEMILDGGTRLTPEIQPNFEYGVLVDFGLVRVNGEEVKQHQLAYVAPGERLEHRGRRPLPRPASSAGGRSARRS